jgi:hypothetical protein
MRLAARRRAPLMHASAIADESADSLMVQKYDRRQRQRNCSAFNRQPERLPPPAFVQTERRSDREAFRQRGVQTERAPA